MPASYSRIFRWLTLLAGGVAATLAALWVVRRRNLPQAAVADHVAGGTAAGETGLADLLVATPTLTAPTIPENVRPLNRWRVALAWLIGVVSCVTIIIAAVIFQ